MNNKKRGFTLIELLFVLAIITLVVTTTVVSYITISNKQKEKDYTTMLTNMKTASEVYLTKNVVANTALKEQGYVNIEVEELVREGLLNEYYTVDPKTKESMIGYCIIGSQDPIQKNNEFSNPIRCGSYLSMNTLTIEKREFEDQNVNVLYRDIEAFDEKGSKIVENLSNLITIYSINGNIKDTYTVEDLKTGDLSETNTNKVVYEYDGKYFEREVIVLDNGYCFITINDEAKVDSNGKRVYVEGTILFSTLGISIPTRPGYNFLGYYLNETRIIETSNITCENPTRNGTAIELEARWEAADSKYIVNYIGQSLELNSYNKTIADPKDVTENIKTDTEISYEQLIENEKIIPGFWLNTAEGSVTKLAYDGLSSKLVKPAENNIFTEFNLYYTRNIYTLILKAGTNVNAITASGCTTTATPGTYTCLYGASVTVTATAASGYTVTPTLVSSNANITASNKVAFSMPALANGTVVTLTANATPNTNTKYVVEHYLMNTSGAYPTTATSTQTLYGTTGATLTLANLRYTTSAYNVANGIYYSHGQVDGTTSTTTNILGNGTRVIKLYYARTYGYLTTTKSGYTSTFTKYENKKMYYGGKITVSATIPATTAQYSYSFKWNTNNQTYLPATTALSYTITWRAMPNGTSLTLTAAGTRTLRKYPVTITSSPSNGGTIVVKNGTTTITTGTNVNYGTNLTITYTPTSGWTKLSSTATSITVVGNTSITASWKQMIWKCTSSNYGTGTGSTIDSACSDLCSNFPSYTCDIDYDTFSGNICKCAPYTSYTWGDGTYDPCGGYPCWNCVASNKCVQE